MRRGCTGEPPARHRRRGQNAVEAEAAHLQVNYPPGLAAPTRNLARNARVFDRAPWQRKADGRWQKTEPPKARGRKRPARPARAKPPKATPKPPQSHILGIDSGVQSHPKATPRLPQGYPKATPRLPQGYPKATPRLHQGYTKARIERGMEFAGRCPTPRA